MSHSMKTPNFDLPLFADNDSPTWLGDFNDAMGTLDTAMAKVANDSNSQVNAIANLTTRVEDCEEKVGEIDQKVSGYDAAIAGKAPVLHADATVKYGAATADLYGHVRLEDAPGDYGAGDGRAATPKALLQVSEDAEGAHALAETAQQAAQSATLTAQNASNAANAASTAASKAEDKAEAADRKAQQALDLIGQGGEDPSTSFAPVNHADTTTKYGIGNTTKYGHVKVSDTINTANASSGVAASPLAVKNYVDEHGGGEPDIIHTTTTGEGGTADYVYDPRTKLVVIRVYGSELTFDYGKEYLFGTIPSSLRPARQYECGCVGTTGDGAATLFVSANRDGNIVVKSWSQTHYDNVLINGTIAYYAGV